MSDEKRKELNSEASTLLKDCLGVDELVYDDYDELRDYAGYAEYYLQECWDKSQMKNNADVAVYKQLLEIDSKLGTTQSEQLFGCVSYSLRIDLIQV